LSFFVAEYVHFTGDCAKEERPIIVSMHRKNVCFIDRFLIRRLKEG
jgi:hypothetical protein